MNETIKALFVTICLIQGIISILNCFMSYQALGPTALLNIIELIFPFTAALILLKYQVTKEYIYKRIKASQMIAVYLVWAFTSSVYLVALISVRNSRQLAEFSGTNENNNNNNNNNNQILTVYEYGQFDSTDGYTAILRLGIAQLVFQVFPICKSAKLRLSIIDFQALLI